MRFATKILLCALLSAVAGCREIPAYFGGRTLARVGDEELREHDLRAAMPKGLAGDDSASYAALYVDRWVLRQVKLQEAEQLFSASAADIEKAVEEYRQALLIRKLDQHYVDQRIDTTFSEADVRAYYESHREEFKLDRTVVRGRIVRFSNSYRQAAQLKTLIASSSAERQQDLADICAKNNFDRVDCTSSWVDYGEFLSYLPVRRSSAAAGDEFLRVGQVQELRDNDSRYYFLITEVLRAGETAPLELQAATIRRILFNRRQSEIIRAHEEQRLKEALERGEARIFDTTE